MGGEFFETVLSHMNTDGRVSVCGCISQYNLTETPKGTYLKLLCKLSMDHLGCDVKYQIFLEIGSALY